jgi:LysR family transcriptional regulator, glycine cleavage system transcriptional activator
VTARRPAPLNALRAFEAAARHLSFQAAAAELFVTPAAVSHQVKRLEDHLGVALFVRGHRTVELTDAGAALATSAGETFDRLDRALARASGRSHGNLRVSTIESFAAKWLAPRLVRFHRACPDVGVRIDTGNQHAGFGRDGVDVAIRYGPGGYREVHVVPLLDAPVFPVCAPALCSDPRKPLADPADLRLHTLLHDDSARGRDGVPDWPAWLHAAGASTVDAAGGPVFASIYLAQEAAIAGHGVALGVGPLVEDDLASGRLVKPFDLALPNAYSFWLVSGGDAAAHPAVEAFTRWLREEVARHPEAGAVAGSAT